jgi:hypothetical protein
LVWWGAVILEKYSFGMGDRFAHEGEAQLAAVQTLAQEGTLVVPVWNKSNREHNIVKSHPDDVRQEADTAVQRLGWTHPYHVDADHIGLATVDRFLAASDFFTLDVADFVGREPEETALADFVEEVAQYFGGVSVPGLEAPLQITRKDAESAARRFLCAMQEAGRIYRHLVAAKGEGTFITEVSVDETDEPQGPVELFLILAMLAREKVPAQTIAPKFTGRFNKGVDYVGDLAQFRREFAADLAVLQFAVREFGFPSSLKLSVHSGSDKFSLYPIIKDLLRQTGAGLHLKTAGTTWLEEVIGLAESGGEGLAIAREIYHSARGRFEELTGPYATVIDIEPSRLPSPEEVAAWDGDFFAATLRHDQANNLYNPDFRQLIHVAFKVAAELGERYRQALHDYRPNIERNVTVNLLERHLRPVFGGLS